MGRVEFLQLDLPTINITLNKYRIKKYVVICIQSTNKNIYPWSESYDGIIMLIYVIVPDYRFNVQLCLQSMYIFYN